MRRSACRSKGKSRMSNLWCAVSENSRMSSSAQRPRPPSSRSRPVAPPMAPPSVSIAMRFSTSTVGSACRLSSAALSSPSMSRDWRPLVFSAAQRSQRPSSSGSTVQSRKRQKRSWKVSRLVSTSCMSSTESVARSGCLPLAEYDVATSLSARAAPPKNAELSSWST